MPCPKAWENRRARGTSAQGYGRRGEDRHDCAALIPPQNKESGKPPTSFSVGARHAVPKSVRENRRVRETSAQDTVCRAPTETAEVSGRFGFR
jgi:hypothetical protein